MTNTRDQMQDVFPIVFDYKAGEQPTSEKLTGLIKHTDSAFSQITQGIGDPWDYSLHDDGTGSRLNLSLENLGQSSIARVLGSSDWLSPMGGCWNEAITVQQSFTLRSNRNSWILGFPLVKLSSSINKSSVAGVLVELTWGTEIGITSGSDTTGVFADKKDTLEEVVEHGDFHVDFYKGVITSYSILPANVTGYINSANMFGPGVPWGTHNVIPHWNQTTLCNVAKSEPDTATTSTYLLTFPAVANAPRKQTGSLYFGSATRDIDATYSNDIAWTESTVGNSSYYRLPSALTTSGMSAGTIIPEGYLLLWDGDRDGRIVPQVTFYYYDENHLTLVTPVDWLDLGDNYRIITSGTSTADAIQYLMQLVRNNEHIGVANYPTVSYTMPLSHDNLEDRFTGNISSSLTDLERWQYRESSYQTNVHPQYLHRGGYMADDLDGNSANAMRGDLVMAGDIDGTEAFLVGDSGIPRGAIKTAALAFGGGNTTKEDYTANTFIRFEGTKDDNSWELNNHAERSLFGLENTGTNNGVHTGTDGGDTNALGMLSIYGWRGTPLYLRGYYPGGSSYDKKDYGATLGFDMAHRGEANYIKLLRLDRTNSTAEVTYAVNQPANVGQTRTSALDITPGLTRAGVWDSYTINQFREFRFRAIPYVSSATNINDSVGGIDYRSTAISEFNHYFVSPAVVGADFFAVYSNAIFFSDDGEGNLTSLNEHGEAWLDNGNDDRMPSGIYYVPSYGSSMPYIQFSMYDGGYSGGAKSTRPLTVGGRYGFKYEDNDGTFVAQTGSTFSERATALATAQSRGIATVIGDYSTSSTVNSGMVLFSRSNDIRIATGEVSHIISTITFTSTHGAIYSDDDVSTHSISLLADSCLWEYSLGTEINKSVHLLGDSTIMFGDGTPRTYSGNVIISAGQDIAYGDTPTIAGVGHDATVSNEVHVFAYDDIQLFAGDNIGLRTDSSIGAGSAGNINLTSGNNVNISADNDINIDAAGDITVSDTIVSSSYLTITALTDTLTMRSNDGNVSINAFGSGHDVSITAADDINITASDTIFLSCGDDVDITAGTNDRILLKVPLTSDFATITGSLGTSGVVVQYITSSTAGDYNVEWNQANGKLVVNSSSERYKKDIETINDVSWIYNLRPVTYRPKNIEDGTNKVFGLIAEEVAETSAAEQLVLYNGDGLPNSVRYISIISPLIKAVQDQKKEIDELKAKLALAGM